MDNVRTPLVSVLIPVYKRYELAVEAIDSALSQDYSNIEIIVCDNCSPDGTFERLKEKYLSNDKISLSQNSQNIGAVGNWKECFSRARGEFVKFLWSDDLMSRDCIRKNIETLQKFKSASFSYSNVSVFTNGEKINDGSLLFPSKKDTEEQSAQKFIKEVFSENYRMPVSPGCAVFRRMSVAIEGNIPNGMNYNHSLNGAGPDLLMFLNALRGEEKCVYIGEILNYFRAHGEAITCSDSSIEIGYATAKTYYLAKNQRYVGLTKYLSCEIVHSFLGKKGYCSKLRKALLSEYYDGFINNAKCWSSFLYLKWRIKWHIWKRVIRK